MRIATQTQTVRLLMVVIFIPGGAAVWPLAARSQQPDGMRRIDVLMAESDPEGQALVAAFREGLTARIY